MKKQKDNPGSNSVYRWQYDIDILGYKYYMIDLTAAIGLMFLLILLSLYITQISMMFGNIMLVIFLALFSLIGYLFLSSRFTKVLIAYEKENVVNWEFIIIPKEIQSICFSTLENEMPK